MHGHLYMYMYVHLNVSCLIFWLAILEKCTENGQWPPVVFGSVNMRLCMISLLSPLAEEILSPSVPGNLCWNLPGPEDLQGMQPHVRTRGVLWLSVPARQVQDVGRVAEGVCEGRLAGGRQCLHVREVPREGQFLCTCTLFKTKFSVLPLWGCGFRGLIFFSHSYHPESSAFISV